MMEAENALKDIFVNMKFGNKGNFVLIEEYLDGDEVSYIALTDGKHIVPFVTSQDHNAIFDGYKGPNTGGMGAYSPAPIIDKELFNTITKNTIEPLIKTRSNMGITYRVCIYAVLMIPENTPNPLQTTTLTTKPYKNRQVYVLEFNCRLGDPETQPILMRMNDDLLDVFFASLDGSLYKKTIKWYDDYAVNVAMASEGYPNEFQKGFEIKGLEKIIEGKDLKVFHSATKLKDGKIISDGGRVLSVTSMDKSLELAIQKTYNVVNMIDFENAYFRKDIGQKGCRRL
jgi:phosphoribosylamine--glycine ligase